MTIRAPARRPGREDEVEDDDRARQVVVERREDREDHDQRGARERGGAKQRREVAREEVAPPLVVEAEQREDDRLADRDERDRGHEHLDVAVGNLARVDETQDERERECDGGQDRVGQELEGAMAVGRVGEPAHGALNSTRGSGITTARLQ